MTLSSGRVIWRRDDQQYLTPSKDLLKSLTCFFLLSASLAAKFRTMAAMEIDGGAESKALFAQVHFYIRLTDDFDEQKAEAVSP